MSNKTLLLGGLALAAAMSFSAISNAQTLHPMDGQHSTLYDFFQKNKAHQTQFKMLFPKSIQALRQKPTAEQSRLSAYISSSFDGVRFVPEDSLHFYWSGTNKDNRLDEYFIKNAFSESVPNFTLYSLAEEYPIMFQADSLKVYEWQNGPSTYKITGNTTQQLDANGNVIQSTNYEFDGTNWMPINNSINDYDNANNLIQVIRQNWNSGVWDNSQKYIYNYDGNGNLIQTISMDWNISASTWENYSRKNFNYNSQNLLTEQIYQGWNNAASAWVNLSKLALNYNANQTPAQASVYYWNTSTNSWSNNKKLNYEYNASNQLTQELFWTGADTVWNVSEKYTHTYNAVGQHNSTFQQYWNSSNWIYTYKWDYQYNGNALKMTTVLEWVNDAIRFKDITRFVFSSNEHGQYTSVYPQEWDSTAWRIFTGFPKLTFLYETFNDGNDSTGNTGINRINDDVSFMIYPNPAKNQINIQVEKRSINSLKIVDASGRVVYQSNNKLNAQHINIPVSQLTAGTYFLKINTEGKDEVKPFTVQP